MRDHVERPLSTADVSPSVHALWSLFTVVAVLLPPWAHGQVVEYYHVDAIGSVRAVTDQSGALAERHDYLPFGEECTSVPCNTNPAVGAGNPRKFIGKERDVETGFDYLEARYYVSANGRLTAVDPDNSWQLVNPQSWNRYAYSLNNPLRYLDRNGRWPTHVETTHQESIDRVLGSTVSKQDRKILKKQQVVADNDQSTEGGYKHAMRGPNQSVADARRQANEFVRSEIEQARKLEKAGRRKEAMVHLGNAMHALQDATSPSHVGFQPWDEKAQWPSEAFWDHEWPEYYDPGKGSALDTATSDSYDYFTGKKAMPEDFFAGRGSDKANPAKRPQHFTITEPAVY